MLIHRSPPDVCHLLHVRVPFITFSTECYFKRYITIYKVRWILDVEFPKSAVSVEVVYQQYHCMRTPVGLLVLFDL